MSALDKMRVAMGGPVAGNPRDKKTPEPQVVGQRAPNMMEAAMLRMLEGVGLDANALQKMQGDISNFATFCKVNLDAIREENRQILENQAGILAMLTEIQDDHRNNREDGK